MQLFFRIPRVAEAFQFAVNAHGNQMYGNLPYFTHLLAVAENLPNPTENELVAAMLHDTVEDTNVGFYEIERRFGGSVVDIVHLVTKDDDLDYKDNILRIIKSKNYSAMRVKWADNLANMTADKSHMDAARRNKLNGRYAESFALLASALGI